MIFDLIIIGISLILMILLIIFKPSIKVGNIEFHTYYLPILMCAIALLAHNPLDAGYVMYSFTHDSSANPIKILILFISMSFLSIVLDEAGLFKFLALESLKIVKNNQITLFFILNGLIAILTIFTSNDIIILTFTPFIIQFSKNAKINPIPYLISQFICANTFSMFLLIGNPTNIYICSYFSIDFFEYIKYMGFPTIFAEFVSIFLVYLIFRKDLKKPMELNKEDNKISNKFIVYFGSILLLAIIILLAISGYINLEMYLICGIGAVLMFIALIIYSLIKKKGSLINSSIKRVPFQLIPLLISMFVICYFINNYGISKNIGDFLGIFEKTYSYGIASSLSCNVINNIPMSVLFSDIIQTSANKSLEAIFATVIGSNIGAFFTPIGALAGIMWMSILKDNNIKFTFFSFIKYCLPVGGASLIVALSVLKLIFLIF